MDRALRETNVLHCNENINYVFPFLKIVRPQSQFQHSCVCERFIFPQDWSTYFLQQNRQIYRGSIKSLTDTWMWNWDWGRAIPLLGIFFPIFGIGSVAVWAQVTPKNSLLQDIQQYSFSIGQNSQINKCYTLQQKSHLSLPFLGIARPQS